MIARSRKSLVQVLGASPCLIPGYARLVANERARTRAGQTLSGATIEANREMMVALNGSDFREGVASFMEKRPPRFTGK
ncbi:enoyl-CoA hydratase/carnithine racemase [Bradyrhizobium sp. S3.2.6]